MLRRGTYVSFGDDWVALGDPGAPFGPLSVAVRGLRGALSITVAGAPARVVGRRLLVGGCPVSLRAVRERSRITVGQLVSSGCPPGSGAAGRAALRELGAPPARLRDGIEQLASGAVEPGVRALAGLGDGLTPAGDDVLAGYAAWSATAGRRRVVAELARGRSSPLGLAYLHAAEHSELPDGGAALLAAVLGGSAPEAAVAARGLRTWGASSGAGLGWGILAGATQLFRAGGPGG